MGFLWSMSISLEVLQGLPASVCSLPRPSHPKSQQGIAGGGGSYSASWHFQ